MDVNEKELMMAVLDRMDEIRNDSSDPLYHTVVRFDEDVLRERLRTMAHELVPLFNQLKQVRYTEDD